MRLEPDELGREAREPVVLLLRIAVRDDKVVPRHPATLTERLLEHRPKWPKWRGAAGRQVPDSVDLAGLLRPGDERRGEQTKGEGSDELDDGDVHDNPSKQ
jgi:hypothetical protein